MTMAKLWMHAIQLSVGDTQADPKDSNGLNHGMVVIPLIDATLTKWLPIIRWLLGSSLCLVTSLRLSCLLIGS